MFDHLLQFSFGYFSALPFWQYAVITFVLTHLTAISVTLYLHRCQAHRSIELHSAVSHFFRFWLWLTTSIITKEWVAVHRKHHTKVETVDDPHSPIIHGIAKVFFEGAELYRHTIHHDTHLLERYGNGTPEDAVENYLYSRLSNLGIFILLILQVFCLGLPGLIIWAIQMMWVPLAAAGVINGIGHYWGYRNFETQDASRNILPLGLLCGGEELHNNHHTYANSAKFSVHWWEFDYGWLVIRFLGFCGLAKPHFVPPKLAYVQEKTAIDAETLRALMRNRFQVLSQYSKKVILPVLREEKRQATPQSKALLARARTLLVRDASLIDAHGHQKLATTLAQFNKLSTAYQLRVQLQNLWKQTTATQKELIESLHQWCQQAETSGIQALQNFVTHLKSCANT
jgi:stearoyl-CoA desaturase (delta-9 desaturase)